MQHTSLLFIGLLLSGANAWADSRGFVEHGADSLSHGSASSAHILHASGQATSAAVAAPLALSGQLSSQVAADLQDAAAQPIGQPLAISEESFHAGPPPDQALQAPAKE